MRKFGLAVAAIISLVFSVLLPAGPVMSVDTVNKSFTVTKSDGTPYSGVSVALIGWDDGLQQSILSTLATTDVEGQATLAVSPTVDFYGYAAQPPVNDFTHAVFVDYGISLGAVESRSIQMRPANLVVELKQTSGAAALPGSWVYFPGTGDVGESLSARPVLRSGPIAIDVSTGLSSTEKYLVKAEPNGAPSQFWSEFGLKVSDANEITLYTDSTATTPITPRVVDGTQIYDLSFSSANIRGKISNASGQTQTLPAGVTARVSFFRADSLGALDPEGSASAESVVSAAGTYDAKITKTTAGKYFALFTISGSLSIPSFTSEPFYIDANGQYGNSVAGPFVAPESFLLNSQMPNSSAINFKVRVVEPNGTTTEDAYIYATREFESGRSMFVGVGRAANGLASMALADGLYNVSVEFVNPERTRKEYSLVVDQGEAALTLRGGVAVAPDANGVFQLSGGVPNLKIRVVNPNNPSMVLNNVSLDVVNPNIDGDRYVTNAWSQTGFAYLSVPDGNYELRINPQSSSFAEKAYTFVVNGSSVTLTDPDSQAAVTAVNGVFSVAPNLPNITGRIVNSAGQPVSSQGNAWVNVELQKWNEEDSFWDGVKNGNAQVMADGTFSLRAATLGTFRLNLRSAGRLDVANTVTGQFEISNLTSVTERGNITMDAPLMKVRVSQSGRTAYLNSAQINVSDREGYDTWADTGSIGAAALSFPSAGTYYVTVNPPSGLSTALAANKTYEVVVTETAGALSASVTGVTASSGFYDLSLGLPNVTGKIIAPDGSSITRANGVWININAQKLVVEEDRWDWTNYWTQIASDGSFGLSLEEIGTYRLRIEPNGIDDAAQTRTVEFDVTESNIGSVAKAFGSIRLSAPTAKFKVRLPGSNSDIKYAGIEIRKDNNFYDWITTNQKGIASFSALEVGAYEFVTNPNGDSSLSGVRKTYTAVVTETPSASGNFIVTVSGVAVDSNGFTVLNLGVPNVTGKLVDPNGVVVRQQKGSWVNIQLQKYNDVGGFWDWQNKDANVRNDGTFGLSVTEAGTYRLIINPSGRQDIARTVTSQFVITTANASTFVKSFGSITLNGPSLSGTVSSPDGLQKLANSQVIAIDAETGQEMWEYATQSDYLGRWSMMLPKGSYSIFARSPWGNQTYGSGDPTTGIAIDQNGIATLVSGDASALNLRVSIPTWSGKIFAPGTTTPLPYTNVCLFQETAAKPTNQCTESDAQGDWALSKPTGFTGFNETTQLEIRENRSPQFAAGRHTGKTAVEAQLGVYEPGETYVRNLSPLAPNASITITAGNNAAANLWVSIERDNDGFITSGMTNAQGVVRLNIPTIGSGFKIRAQVDSNRELAAVYSTTLKSISAGDVTGGTVDEIFSATVALSLPNFAAQILTPGLDAVGVQNSWVDAYNLTTNNSAGGSNSSATGNVALKLDLPSVGNTYKYRVHVNSPWGNPDLLASRVYFVDVDSSGSMVVHADSETGTVVASIDSKYALSLKSPSIRGTVVLPDNSFVRDSYVNVLKMVQNWEQWLEGGQARANGAFGLALDDGEYELFANVPWNVSGYAKSTRCAVTVTGGALANNNSACVVDGKVKLSLREPNLKFKMVHVGAAVANANVSIQIGNWHTWAQSGRDGTVAVFIDDAEVAAKNPRAGVGSSLEVRITVDPPYGNNDIVRWECIAGQAKPICGALGNFIVGTPFLSAGAATNLGNIEFATPNTRVNVKIPVTEANAGAGAWVGLFVVESGWKRWIGGSNTNSEGQAAFNIDAVYLSNSATRFSVEVNASHQQRETYSQKSYGNLTWAQLNDQSFALGTPNLKLTIMQALSADASSWAWVGVEEVDPASLNNIGWLGGYGTDQQGRISLTLPSNKTVRLSLNPGPGSNGARTSCIFTVDALGVVAKSATANQCPGNLPASVSVNNAIQLELGAGNLVGIVTKGTTGQGLAGAIVYAQAYENGTAVAGKSEQASTKIDGRYGLQLDAAYDWKIKVFFVNPDGAVENYESFLTERAVAGSTLGSQNTQDFALAVR